MLKPGKYCLINDLKKDKNYYNELLKRYQKETQYYSPVNKECLDKWYNSCDFSIEVTAAEENRFNYNVHKPCSWHRTPCVEYKGPYPP